MSAKRFSRREALGLLASAALGSACSRTSSSERRAATPTEVSELRYQSQPGVVVLPELADDLGYLKPLRLNAVGSTVSGPQDIQSVATGDVDFGLAFNGAVLKLVAARAPIRAVVGGYGVDPLVLSGVYVLADSPIKSARDLIGKRVGMNTLGAHSEFVIREYLRRNGLHHDEASKVTMIALPPVNLEQSLREKQLDAISIGQVFREKALERGGLRPIFTDYDLYGTFTAGSYVLRTSFIEENPNASRKFVEAVGKAVEWSRSTPREQVVARHLAIIAKRKRNENGSVSQYWKGYGVAGRGGLIAERELTMWLEWLERDQQLTKGQLKLSDVYTNALNPFANEV